MREDEAGVVMVVGGGESRAMKRHQKPENSDLRCVSILGTHGYSRVLMRIFMFITINISLSR